MMEPPTVLDQLINSCKAIGGTWYGMTKKGIENRCEFGRVTITWHPAEGTMGINTREGKLIAKIRKSDVSEIGYIESIRQLRIRNKESDEITIKHDGFFISHGNLLNFIKIKGEHYG